MSPSWTTIHDPSDAPSNPGVYIYLAGRQILYIGKAVNLRARLKSHAQNAKYDAVEKAIHAQATAIKYTLTDTDFLALILEAKLIQKHQPRYNRALKDDKSYLYIVINLNDEYPKPRLVRGRDLPAGRHGLPSSDVRYTKSNTRLFGPFGNSRSAEDLLRTIRRLVPFCQQKGIGRRACFYHKLGYCDPCPSAIHSRQERLRYRRQIRQVIKILNGQVQPVIKAIEEQMAEASLKEDYELALSLRNKIYRFQRTIASRTFNDTVIDSYSTSDQALQELSALLSTMYHQPSTNLHRIEAYDASTFQLTHSVVSMVVALDGRIDTSQYRRFKIKNPRVRSDFDMLAEALERRLRNHRWPRPDLLVIDGGRPQLRRLQRILDQVEHPPLMIGLAKHPDKLIVPNFKRSAAHAKDSSELHASDYLTVSLASDSPALHLLQRLRDEAHRFANAYRKILEKKSKQL